MDLPRGIDDYIKESIDDSLGIPVPSQTLEARLRASEESRWRLREQHLSLLLKLKQKDQLIESLKSESNMNARALKKFVEENQRLASECENLINQCEKWEKECELYDHDREVLMEFGNNADERAQVAQSRVTELERDLIMLESELKKYKHRHELVNSSSDCTTGEKELLDSLLATLTTSEEDDSTCRFLELHSDNDSCRKLLSMWNCLKPSTQRVLSLVAKVKSLEKDKENLRTNLHKAEEEVKLLSDENNLLDKENKRLFRIYKERNHPGSAGKHTSSASAKSNKRKTSPRTSSPTEKIDFDSVDSARQPLSPLGSNSPDCRLYKK